MARFVATIDQGTTSTRCALVDESGALVMVQREHRQIYPQPGWVEHDAGEIWQRVIEVVEECRRRAGAGPGEIAAVGITNQRETTVAWDRRTGRPLYRAIVWQDTRTQAICDQVAATAGHDGLRDTTGLPVATYFAAPKLRWMLENVPAVRQAAAAGTLLVGTIDSYLVWRLTGGADGGRHVTDVTNASRTLLMDLRTCRWDDRLLELFGVPREALPEIVPSSDRTAFGTTRTDGPFAAAVPIAGVLGDQQAALVGQACFAPGSCKNTYGTGCFLLLNTGMQPMLSRHGLLTTVAYQFAPERPCYALEGSVAMAGALVQWLRDGLGIIGASDQIEGLALQATDNGGVYLVPAFSGLFAPYWRPDARGLVIGLSGHSTKAHIARAALEATAYQSLDVLRAMQRDAGATVDALRVDGGMTGNDLLMQFQADLLGAPVVVPQSAQTTALGAAYAAGLAVGFWPDQAAVARLWQARRRWEPRLAPARRDRLVAQWHRAVERSLGWVAPGD